MLADGSLIVRRRGVGSIVVSADPVTEVRVAPGTVISARLPTAAERQAARAGLWVPVLSVIEPGRPEQLHPADRVVIITPGAQALACPPRRLAAWRLREA